MKIHCNRDKFQAAFAMAASATAARSVTTALANVKLVAEPRQALMFARDNDSALMIQVPEVEVERPGEVVLPKERFSALLRELKDERFSLDAEDAQAVVKGERARFKLQTSDPAEFPPFEGLTGDRHHRVGARFLREMIKRTVFAADEESTRYALGGVLFEMQGEDVVAVGTDGRRLARMQGPGESVGEHRTLDATTIVPAKALRMMDRCLAVALAENADAVARFASDERRVLLECENVTYESRLAEGRFPRWREVIPARQEGFKVDLPVGALLIAVSQAAIATSEESRGVVFHFSPGSLVLSARAANVGDTRVELPLAYEGQEIKISLDPRYFKEFLSVLDAAQTFTMSLRDAESAALCTTQDGYAYVIMPLAGENV